MCYHRSKRKLVQKEITPRGQMTGSLVAEQSNQGSLPLAEFSLRAHSRQGPPSGCLAADKHLAEWNPAPTLSKLSAASKAFGEEKRGKAMQFTQLAGGMIPFHFSFALIKTSAFQATSNFV